MQEELDRIKERYAHRGQVVPADKYLLTNPHILLGVQEKERKMVKLLRKNDLVPLRNKKILEVGCGTGSNLLDFLRLGAQPENIRGNDLLENRIAVARKRLPEKVQLFCGDASAQELEKESFDLILQSTVFTSILEDAMQEKLAYRMWSQLKPGGYIIWFDILHGNPYNPDVRAIPLKRIKMLFPQGTFQVERVTLFPFIGQAVTRHVNFPYFILGTLPFLKMHLLCFIRKPA
ncbi:MAG: class I SAM-dependent methyltransferase [Ethanoligenens sp.]